MPVARRPARVLFGVNFFLHSTRFFTCRCALFFQIRSSPEGASLLLVFYRGLQCADVSVFVFFSWRSKFAFGAYGSQCYFGTGAFMLASRGKRLIKINPALRHWPEKKHNQPGRHNFSYARLAGLAGNLANNCAKKN